jgi:hypothetical protein
MKQLLLVIGILVLTLGCSVETAEKLNSQESIESALAQTNTNQDISELCNVFVGIRNTIDESGGDLNSAEDWGRRIIWTGLLLQAAPQDYKEEAAVYLQLVKDRAEFLAGYNYVQINELPMEVRTSFISEHMDEQLISNRLIAYATSNCF